MVNGQDHNQFAQRTVNHLPLSTSFNATHEITILIKLHFLSFSSVFCLVPPLIEHARHSALPEQATFELDSTVQYHCFTGYVTAGFPRAKCLAIDGQASWYGPDINCEPRTCGK